MTNSNQSTVTAKHGLKMLEAVKNKYGVSHVYVQHIRKNAKPRLKLVDKEQGLYQLVDTPKMKGGYTVVSVNINGKYMEAKAVCSNDTIFNKRIGYTQALKNLLDIGKQYRAENPEKN